MSAREKKDDNDLEAPLLTPDEQLENRAPSPKASDPLENKSPTTTTSLLKENLYSTVKRWLKRIAEIVRRQVINEMGTRIAGSSVISVMGDVVGPVFTMQVQLVDTLTHPVMNPLRAALEDPASEGSRKFLSFCHFAMLSNALINIPLGLLPVLFMPEICENLLGNPALNQVKTECRLLALAAVFTGISATASFMTQALSQKRQTRDAIFKTACQELPMIAVSLLALHQKSFLLLSLGQVLFTGVGALASYKNLRDGLKEIGCPLDAKDREPLGTIQVIETVLLSEKEWEKLDKSTIMKNPPMKWRDTKREVTVTRQKNEKWHYIRILMAGYPIAVGEAALRIIFMLRLTKMKSAPSLSFYYNINQIYFTLSSLLGPITKMMSIGGNLKEYRHLRKINEHFTVAFTTVLSCLATAGFWIGREGLISYVNPVRGPDDLTANALTLKYYSLILAGTAIQGAALSYLDKVKNINQKRLLGGLVDNLPQIIAVFAAFGLSAEMMVVAALTSWIVGDFCNIAMGMYFPSDPDDPVTDATPPALPGTATVLAEGLPAEFDLSDPANRPGRSSRISQQPESKDHGLELRQSNHRNSARRSTGQPKDSADADFGSTV